MNSMLRNLGCLQSLAVCCSVLAMGCQQHGIEVLHTKTSPNGKWIISGEYDNDSHYYYIILRDTSGTEIVRGSSHLLDGHFDFKPNLAITNNTAGDYDDDGRPYEGWRLEEDSNKWIPIPREKD